MSNKLTATIPPYLIEASIILPIMEQYIIVILYILGFIGALLNIFIFLHKRLRTKSCSIYFLSNSIVDFCYINSYLLMDLIGLFNSTVFLSINSTDLWCKVGNYFYFLLPCLSSTYLTFTSIDRFCASSSNDKLQKLNQLKVSYILALIIFLIWSLFSLHIPISYNLMRFTPTSSVQCNPNLNIAAVFIVIDGYFFALYNGIIVPFFLIIFGLLIFRNVKLIHQRILPPPTSTASTVNHQENIRLPRGSGHLIRMLLFQVSLTIFLHIPYIILYLYGIYNSEPENYLLLLIYDIFIYIGRWFWFMNFCKTFYINILSSKTFRNILKRRILQIILLFHHQNIPNQTVEVIVPRRSYSDSDYPTNTRNQN
jgi:hypothetical protein